MAAVEGVSTPVWLLRVLLLGEDVRRLVREPVEQVPRFPEAAVVRTGAKHHHRNLMIALGQPQQRRQAVASLADEAGFSAEDVDFPATHQMIGVADGDRAPARMRGVAGGPHDWRE